MCLDYRCARSSGDVFIRIIVGAPQTSLTILKVKWARENWIEWYNGREVVHTSTGSMHPCMHAALVEYTGNPGKGHPDLTMYIHHILPH